MLKKQIQKLKKEKKGSAQKETHQFLSVQETFKEQTIISTQKKATTIPSQVKLVKLKESCSYTTVPATKSTQKLI